LGADMEISTYETGGWRKLACGEKNAILTHVAGENKVHILCPAHFFVYLTVFEITEQELRCAYVSKLVY